MKAEEPPKSEDDSSSINRQDENKASTSRLARRAEPSYEIKPNFSRVAPAQLQFVSFPNDGRYHPVRSVSSNVESQRMGKSLAFGLPFEGHASGGGVLILADLWSDEDADFIELEPPAVRLSRGAFSFHAQRKKVEQKRLKALEAGSEEACMKLIDTAEDARITTFSNKRSPISTLFPMRKTTSFASVAARSHSMHKQRK